MRASVRPWICPDHNLYTIASISKQFGTVVALQEEKCHLKHFLGRLTVKVTGVKYRSKWSKKLVRAITCTFMHGFQNNFCSCCPRGGEVPFETCFSGRLKVKVTGVK